MTMDVDSQPPAESPKPVKPVKNETKSVNETQEQPKPEKIIEKTDKEDFITEAIDE